jgi:adenylate kinase
VVLFEAPDDTLVKRLSGRRSCPDCGAVYNVFFNPPGTEDTCDRCGGSLVHRADDNPETVGRRLEVYKEQTAPLVSFYDSSDAPLNRVRADRGVDDVYADFRNAVEGLR